MSEIDQEQGKWLQLHAGSGDEGRRVDLLLRILFPGMERGFLHKSLRKGFVRVSGKKAKADDRLSEGDCIEVPAFWSDKRAETGSVSTEKSGKQSPSTLPLSTGTRTRGKVASGGTAPSTGFPEHDSPRILFSSKECLFIDKPRGMPSHGEGGAVEWLKANIETLFPDQERGLSFSPGPIHRLDRNSSGILGLSLSVEGARAGTSLFAGEGPSSSSVKIAKVYIGLCEGKAPQAGVWRDGLFHDEGLAKALIDEGRGKSAALEFLPLMDWGEGFLAAFSLFTGRYHQIRAQASARGCPLSGDRKYGSVSGRKEYLLHSWMLFINEGARPRGFPSSVVAPLVETLKQFRAPVSGADPEELEARLRNMANPLLAARGFAMPPELT